MKNSNQEMNPLYGASPEDAIDMLIADHKRVANLFAEFERLTDEGHDGAKAAVVAEICQALTIHTQLEEELFYPAARAATGDNDQMDEAWVEHAGAKDLIAQLQAAAPDDDLYNAKVTVLKEQIDHHVEEEEGSIFPKSRYAGVDTQRLGAAMLARKTELLDGAPARTSEESAEPSSKKSARVKAPTAKSSSKKPKRRN